MAICFLLKGWAEILDGKKSDARKSLAKTESIMRPAGMMGEICRLDRVYALIAEAEEDWEAGFRRLAEAVPIAADRGLALEHADLLIQRGRLHLLQYRKQGRNYREALEKCGDDANSALDIAERTQYAWARMDAFDLLAKYYRERARIVASNSEPDRDRENEQASHYARQADELRQQMSLSESQMETAEAEAREIFEQETTDWN